MVSKAHVYRVEHEDDEEDPYNAPTKLAPSAQAHARQLLVERLPPSSVPRVYDQAVEDGDAGVDGVLGKTSSGTMIMPSAPSRLPLAPVRLWQPDVRIHVTHTPQAMPIAESSRLRRRPRKVSWVDRIPTALLVAVIVGSLLVGAAGVAMFLYYC
ncbi:MAG TPA: hypothetical protein VIF62_18460 [Labilithrix sp.]